MPKGTLRLLAIAANLGLAVACIDFGTPVTEVPDVIDTVPDDTDPIETTEHTIELVSRDFVPEHTTIRVGDSITFVNHDSDYHVIFAGTPEDSSHDWQSAEMQFGETWSKTFDTPGVHVFFCDNHSRLMRDASVTVEAR